MRLILLTTWAALILICSLQLSGTVAAQELKTPKDTKQEAKRLWEEAIAAKGGRERLYAVENMVVSSRAREWKISDQKTKLPREEFFVFPNKFWRWSDMRDPGSWGRLEIELFDFERDLGYLLYPEDSEPLRKVNIDPRERQIVAYTQLLYLMETKWQKPRLLGARIERSGFKKYDVVETVVDSDQTDFYLDRKTHLPVKIVEHYVGTISEKIYDIIFNLENYAEVGGIQMPQKIESSGVFMIGINHVKLQTNVVYDKTLFEHPPTAEAGAEAWRLKGR